MHRKSVAILAAFGCALAYPGTAFANVNLVKVSVDIFHNAASQHRTEVEPDTFAFGNTIVAAFQVGRVFGGGSADIGWATSTDGGTTWSHGYLPGITKAQKSTNKYDAVSDPAVAYDAAHGQWLIASLPLSDTLFSSPAVLVSRSSDALHWVKPVGIAPRTQSADKNWIVCDNTLTSPFYGHCYVEWDEPALGDEIMMSTSTDGGLHWSRPKTTVNGDAGIGGQPLVQPNGTVVVPFEGGIGIASFQSTDGGTTWKGATNVANIFLASDPAGIRASPLPSAAVDAAGRIWVAWEDCRFRSGCSSNDIVYTSSTDGTHWTNPARVPIDATSSTVDHFDPGFGIEPGTSGSNAHIGLTFYFFSDVNCNSSTCQLGVGFITSHNGGSSWDAAVQLAGPMKVTWLPDSQNGLMVGDYISTVFASSSAFSVFAVANAPSGGKFDEAMYVPMGGLQLPRFSPQTTAAFDVARPDYRFLHHWRPIPPKAKKSTSGSKTIEKD